MAVLAALAVPALLGAQTSDPSALAARVQARYAGIKDFEGDFVQTYEGGVLRTRTTESGTVAIKRPGRMRFVYTKPERKEFVSDGAKIYTYLVADKQVIVSPAPDPVRRRSRRCSWPGAPTWRATSPPRFTPLPGAAPGLVTLKLVPRKADPEYEWFGIGVDPTTLQIQSPGGRRPPGRPLGFFLYQPEGKPGFDR